MPVAWPSGTQQRKPSLVTIATWPAGSGNVVKSSPSLVMCARDAAACSSCGLASKALLRAGLDGMRRTINIAREGAALVVRKRAKMSSPGASARVRSVSVVASPNTFST